MIYFHSFRSPGLVLDIVGDIRALNEIARKSKKAGMIVLGGGVCKHQIANAMLIVLSLHSACPALMISDSFRVAQWCRLFGVHCMHAGLIHVVGVDRSIFVSDRTLGKNSMVRTPELDQTKPYHGAKYVQGLNLLRSDSVRIDIIVPN